MGELLIYWAYTSLINDDSNDSDKKVNAVNNEY